MYLALIGASVMKTGEGDGAWEIGKLTTVSATIGIYLYL